MAKNLQNSTDAPAASGTGAYRAVVGVEGASQATATLAMFPVTNEEEISVYHLPAGNTVLTLAIARYDLIVSDNPSSTSLEIPTEATLGYTRTAAKELSIFVQRRGAGSFAVNFTGGATLAEDNDIDPSTLAQYHTPVQVCTVAANSWIFN